MPDYEVSVMVRVKEMSAGGDATGTTYTHPFDSITVGGGGIEDPALLSAALKDATRQYEEEAAARAAQTTLRV
jgi:hypothetical protein